MFRRAIHPAVFIIAVFLCLVFLNDTNAREPGVSTDGKNVGRPDRALVIDGSSVHDIGNLGLHITNWGMIGSMPSAAMPFSAAPSAEYPAGSGVEYLYAGGLWVGAIVGGVPKVSTAAYSFEFRPTADPIDVVYYAAEGDPGGNRLPHPNADDDGDGLIDEEWLDGRDNDGDGLIDEDYAAISDQMLSCWYTDDQPEATQIYPDHDPLHIKVNQRSYQWSNSSFDDFVAIDYTITNTGPDLLEDVYIGMFFDGDAGNRGTPNYWEDDATGYFATPMQCTQYGGTSLSFAYVYDADGDGGQTTGKCGVLMLGHLTDPTGQLAPKEVGFNTYASFYGDQPFENGGDPTNDFERYELMSSRTIERNNDGPADVRFLVSVGPFSELAPGEQMNIRMAVFAGDSPGGGLIQVRENAALAKLVYEGQWFDLDADPATGVAGRETPIEGPATGLPVDTCASPPVILPVLPLGQVAWINTDCAEEALRMSACGWGIEDSMLVLTGVGGRETQVHWMLPDGGPVPVFISNFAGRPYGTAAELRWVIEADEPVEGFRLYRATSSGPTVAIPSSSALLPADSRGYIDNDVVPGQRYTYTLRTVLPDGSEMSSFGVEIAVPERTTRLFQNTPNPFNPVTTISFVLAETEQVSLSVYSPDGKLVVRLVDGVLPAGAKDVTWNGTNANGDFVGSGIYFYRLKAGKTTISRKMILLK
jgi:hypothetical protein